MRRGAEIVLFGLLLPGCDLLFELNDPTPDAKVEPEPVPACTTPMNAIADNFSDGILLPLWRESEGGGNPVTEQNGNAEFEMVIGAGTSELRTVPAFDLRESSISIAANADTALMAGSALVLELESIDYDRATNQGQSLRMALIGDQLLAQYTDNDNNPSTLTNLSYSSGAHAFWKIAHEGTTTKWSFSGDGALFSPMFEFDFPFPVGFVRPRLAVTTTGQPLVGRFDGLNGGGLPIGSVCPASGLRDNFTTLDPALWGRINTNGSNCTIGIEDGQLAIVGGGAFGCDLGTSGIYNLIDHSFAVRVEADLAFCGAWIEVTTLDGGIARFDLRGGELRAQTMLVGESLMDRGTMPYDPENHRYWRFTGGLGPTEEQELTWEVSPDGVSYQPFIKVANFVELERAQLTFHLDGIAEAAGCSARFDNVNL